MLDVAQICAGGFNWINKETTLSTELFEWICVHTPCVMVKFEGFENVSHVLIRKQALRSSSGHPYSFLVCNLIVVDSRKDALKLSLRHHLIQEGEMSDVVSQLDTSIVIAHYNGQSPHVLGEQLDTAVLDHIVRSHCCANFSRVKHPERKAEKVLHPALANHLNCAVRGRGKLLVGWFEYDLEVCQDQIPE